MKKIIISTLILFSIISNVSYASGNNEFDLEINSMYAANKLDDTFNLILKVPQENRTPLQWLLMGNIMLDYGKTEDAESMYKSAIELDNKFYKAYYNLANLYLNQNKYELAIANFKLATKYNKEFAPAYYNLGCTYIKIGELKKAKNALLDAVYFTPTVAEYHYNLAYVYKELGNDKKAQLYLDYYNKIRNND